MHTYSQKKRLFKNFFTLFILIISVLFTTALFSREAKATTVSSLPDTLWCPTPNLAVFKLQGLTTLVTYRLDLICEGGGCTPGDTVEVSDGPFVAVLTAYNLPYTFAINDDPSCLGSGKSIDAGTYNLELCWGAGFDTCVDTTVTFLPSEPGEGACDSDVSLNQIQCNTDFGLKYLYYWYPHSKCDYYDGFMSMQAFDADGVQIAETNIEIPPFDCTPTGCSEDDEEKVSQIGANLDDPGELITVKAKLTYTADSMTGPDGVPWVYEQENTCVVGGDPVDPPDESCADEGDEPFGCGVDLDLIGGCYPDIGHEVTASFSNWEWGGFGGCRYYDMTLTFSDGAEYEAQDFDFPECDVPLLGGGDCPETKVAIFPPRPSSEDYNVDVSAVFNLMVENQGIPLGKPCPIQRVAGPVTCVLPATPCTDPGAICDPAGEPCCGAPSYGCVEGGGEYRCIEDPDPPDIPPPDPGIEPSDPPPVPEYTGPVLEDFDSLIRMLFSVIMPVAIGVIGIPLLAINGYKLMTSQGDPGRVRDAKEGLTSAVIGLVFALLALSVLRIIVETFFQEGVFSP